MSGLTCSMYMCSSKLLSSHTYTATLLIACSSKLTFKTAFLRAYLRNCCERVYIVHVHVDFGTFNIK